MKNFFKIFALFLFAIVFAISILSLYRASLKPNDMAIVYGKIMSYTIDEVGIGKSPSYALIFAIENLQYKIGISLGSSPKENISQSLDTSKTYKFYIDPTIPEIDSTKIGISQINLNDRVVFKMRPNIIGPLFCLALSSFGIIAMIRRWRYIK